VVGEEGSLVRGWAKAGKRGILGSGWGLEFVAGAWRSGLATAHAKHRIASRTFGVMYGIQRRVAGGRFVTVDGVEKGRVGVDGALTVFPGPVHGSGIGSSSHGNGQGEGKVEDMRGEEL
jgi:hypothetical protein